MREATVIISAYNQRPTLELCLLGLARQTTRAFDVVIADDGSTDGTTEFLQRIAPGLPFSLQHVWRRDEGFWKSRILNTAVDAVDSEYLIFIDGDCIPRRDFVQAHLAAREPGFYLCGRDVRMSEQFTRRVTPAYVESGRLDRLNLALLWDGIFGRSKWTLLALPFGMQVPRYLDERRRHTWLKGSNASMWRRDFDRVKGFNESIVNQGREDSDLGSRLAIAGVKPRRVRYRAVVFHCFHKDHQWYRRTSRG